MRTTIGKFGRIVVPTDIVMSAIDSYIGDFGISDLEKACPAVSRDMLRHVLKELKKQGKVVSLG